MVPFVSEEIGKKKAFMFRAPSDWSNLSVHICSLSSFGLSKNVLLSYLQQFACVFRSAIILLMIASVLRLSYFVLVVLCFVLFCFLFVLVSVCSGTLLKTR